MAATSACSRLFAITELAEAVFLDINPTDLLCHVQLTCKAWKSIIATSDLTQELLFLKPVSDSTFHRGIDHKATTSGGIIPVENPFLFMLGHNLDNDDYSSSDSWRQMLVTQPPIQKLHLRTSKDSDRTIDVHETRYGRCIRMGDLAPMLCQTKEYFIHESSAWKIFTGHSQLHLLKRNLRLSLHKEDPDVVVKDGSDAEEQEANDFAWIVDWTR